MKTKHNFISANINFDKAKTLPLSSITPVGSEDYMKSYTDKRVLHTEGMVVVDLRKNSHLTQIQKILTGNDDLAKQRQFTAEGICIKIS